jgi:hypothetical protein
VVELGGVDVPDSVVPDCAPPLLLMVTPDETWVVDDVVPLVDVEPVVAADEGAVPVVPEVVVVAVPVVDSPDVVLDVELVEDDSEEVPVVSAAATPCPVATAVTSHAATAMPPYPPNFTARWAALREGAGLVSTLDEGEANKGLTGEWFSVMGSAPVP